VPQFPPVLGPCRTDGTVKYRLVQDSQEPSVWSGRGTRQERGDLRWRRTAALTACVRGPRARSRVVASAHLAPRSARRKKPEKHKPPSHSRFAYAPPPPLLSRSPSFDGGGGGGEQKQPHLRRFPRAGRALALSPQPAADAHALLLPPPPIPPVSCSGRPSTVHSGNHGAPSAEGSAIVPDSA